MNVPRAVLFSHFVIAANALGCGAQSSANRGHEGGGDSTPSSGASGGSDAGNALAPDAGPRGSSTCSVRVTGAATMSWTDDSASASEAWPTASLDPYVNYGLVPADPADTNLLSIQCSPPYAQEGDNPDFFSLTFPSIAGPGTYSGGSAELDLSCLGCPDWGGFSACTLTLDTFSPADRGGMSGSFSCDSVPNTNAPPPGVSPPTIGISGSFDFAPPDTQATAPPANDAGAPPYDGDPTSCTMHVTGGSGAYDAETAGDGWAYDGTISCEGTVDGVYYSLVFGGGAFGNDGGIAAPPPALDIEGPGFCTPRCDASYVSGGPCSLFLLVDSERDGGPFQATFDCEGFAVVGVPLNAPSDAIRVTGTIDGVLRAPRPPD